MLLFTIAYLGGVLTIVSPCVLPVLPFVFARADRPFLTGTLPILGGMACTFAGIATLAAVGGSWAARFNQLGRVAALVLLALFAGTLISRHFGAWLTRPLVALGNRLTAQPGSASSEHVGGGVLLGVATGLLWAPCAGPILGLVLTGAAISGVNLHTSLLLLAYAAGAASSLAVAIFAGGRALRAMKRFLSAGEWIRRALGATVLLSVVAIAFGWDRGALQRLSLAQTDRLEHALLGRLARQSFEPLESTSPMPPMPSLKGATGWLNSPPLKPESLRGKVVVVDFWTYSCINCLRSLPYVKHWYESYKDHGLVVIGMHTPEFAFERDLDNVRRAVADLNIAYPVALDNEFKVWRAFGNQYWPAHFFIDARGLIRSHHFGEGQYAESEQLIRRLLAEAGYPDLPPISAAPPVATGAQAAAGESSDTTLETYLGTARAANFVADAAAVEGGGQESALAPDQWTLRGDWRRLPERIGLARSPGAIVFRFRARDVHLVMGPAPGGSSTRFKVLLDGMAPGSGHGADIDAAGNGMIREHRLYQLIRLSGTEGHTVEISFPDGGVEAFSFTFG